MIKKLLPPLITLIRTTPAMSLLYECINGIIEGGILEGAEGVQEGEKVAELCVGKLQGMIAVDGDANRKILIPYYVNTKMFVVKYVALLAFNKIVISYPHLVSMHQDVILGCIDDPDISIRLQALDLGSGMVNTHTLISVVDRLMRQLREAPFQGTTNILHEKNFSNRVEPTADSDGEDPEESLRFPKPSLDDTPPMPDDYRTTIIRQILSMCSRDTYANIQDFEWYINILIELVRLVPSVSNTSSDYHAASTIDDVECSTIIGAELRNIAVRVTAVRAEAVKAADLLIANSGGPSSSSSIGSGGHAVLACTAWIVGEYAGLLANKQDTLSYLLIPTIHSFDPSVICAYVQAIPKVLASITSENVTWNAERQTIISLLLARIINFLEPLTRHPNLEVQERSVEFLELMRLAADAVMAHGSHNNNGPLLLTSGLPSLFDSIELNPVAAAAQSRVPLPDGLDLNKPLSNKLAAMLAQAEQEFFLDAESAESEKFYNQQSSAKQNLEVSAEVLPAPSQDSSSYQHESGALLTQKEIIKRRLDRSNRNKDDPFYIGHDEEVSSGTATPFHDILKTSNGQDVDIDSIPIMDLELEDSGSSKDHPNTLRTKLRGSHWQKPHVIADENIDVEIRDPEIDTSKSVRKAALAVGGTRGSRNKKSLLEVDSSGIGSIPLTDDPNNPQYGQLEHERRELEAAEMAKALAEVERLRMEMQRASERIRVAEDIPMEGTLVKRKKKKKMIALMADDAGDPSPVAEIPLDMAVVLKEKKKKKKGPRAPAESSRG